ncbi:MAG: hypothetical protein M1814_002971 [Vezdaea aestivalis]|nr:MAG: hypothetical protein M1814_002971 [Vezdaea aestivalis]
MSHYESLPRRESTDIVPPISPVSSIHETSSPNPPVFEYLQSSSIHSPRSLPDDDSLLKKETTHSVSVRSIKTSPTKVQWPATAQRLAWSFLMLCFDLMLMMIVPSCFLALAAAAASLHNVGTKDSGTFGEQVQRATQLGPSIWPIVFAGIIGRSMKNIARFRAERGSTLGFLEQSMGSTTFLGTIDTAIQLRNPSFLTLGLLLLWSLSPLGGQSSLRLLSVKPWTNHTYSTIPYMNTTIINPASIDYNAVSPLYLAALLASNSSRHAPKDLWDSSKIPLYSSVVQNFEQRDPKEKDQADGYLPVTDAVTYSSLVGVPVGLLPKVDVMLFNITTRYFVFSAIDGKDSVRTATSYTGLRDILPPDLYPWTKDQIVETPTKVFGDSANTTTTDWFLVAISFNSSESTTKALFGARWNSGKNTTGFYTLQGQVEFVEVNSKVVCNPDCKVVRMKKTGAVQTSPLQTKWTLQLLFDRLPYVDGAMTKRASVQYLKGGDLKGSDGQALGNTPGQSTATFDAISDAKPQDVAERLTILLNTYWNLALAPSWQPNGLPTDPLAYTLLPGRPLNSTDIPPGAPFIWNLTQADHIVTRDNFRCNWGWFVVLVAASIIVMLCGICSAILAFKSFIPDILGYVSTLTRDNPHVPLPPGGTLLHGLERAKLLKDLAVRIQDVTPQEPVGHVAFAAIGDRPRKEGRLVWDRFYK